jgi:hypothetical protein
VGAANDERVKKQAEKEKYGERVRRRRQRVVERLELTAEHF